MSDQFGSTEITSDDKLWAALGYPIALIAIIVLLMEDKKNRPFIKFHAIQSIALNVAPLYHYDHPGYHRSRRNLCAIPVAGHFVARIRTPTRATIPKSQSSPTLLKQGWDNPL